MKILMKNEKNDKFLKLQKIKKFLLKNTIFQYCQMRKMNFDKMIKILMK